MQDFHGRRIRGGDRTVPSAALCEPLLDQIKRDDIKVMINALIEKELSRNTVRNALCVIRGIFNEAIEAGIVEVNPAARLGRFTRTAKTTEVKGISLTPSEAEQFLQASERFALSITRCF